MPSMLEHESNTLVKALCLADSGSGKTGALASLVDAGFNVRVLDFDNGLSVLKGYVQDKAKLANVHFATLKDEMQLLGGRMGYKKAPAFALAMDMLEKGGDLWGKGSAIPPLRQWTARDILVVDTLSSLAKSAMALVLQLNGAANKAPEIQHYGLAMENIERLLDMLTSSTVPCHVIVNTHITSNENGTKQYPEALGSKLPPKVAKFFDNMLTISGSGDRRTFKTDKDGLLLLKTAAKLDPTYPIANGWVSIFEGLTGKKVSEIIASAGTAS